MCFYGHQWTILKCDKGAGYKTVRILTHVLAFLFSRKWLWEYHLTSAQFLHRETKIKIVSRIILRQSRKMNCVEFRTYMLKKHWGKHVREIFIKSILCRENLLTPTEMLFFYLKSYYNRIRQLNNDSTVSNR